ncbi:MAG: hypothetical protein NTX01_03905 [Candidatus Omnitrophica bacterium]|nr:hypothetical protein [Candidatus Omnitrophota bacterium]
MKKIIDANFFRDPELVDYLKSNKENMVVFCDYACMESYKGNAIENIYRSIEIVSKFPDQVVVLKGTRDIVKLTLSDNHLELLEDPSQTREFKIFCLGVERAIHGDVTLANQILDNGKIASDHFAKLCKDALLVAQGIKGYTKSYKPEYLLALKKKEELRPEVIDKIIKDIMLLAATLFQNHPDVKIIPQAPQVKNSYIFRFAISAYLLNLRWISDGGIENVNLDRLRNDVVDMNYVTYATFFDGLLTKDNKMEEIYQETCFILEHAFAREQ